MLARKQSKHYHASMEDIQSKGGLARAEALSSEERSEIAAKAAAARWNLPKATHEGDLHLGNYTIHCAVLENGQRVLTQSDFMRALGRARQAKGRAYYDSDVNLPAFLTAKNLKPHIDEELYVTSSQVEFKPLRGSKAFGYPAELLPKVCDVFLKARDAGDLREHPPGHAAYSCGRARAQELDHRRGPCASPGLRSDRDAGERTARVRLPAWDGG